MRPDGGGHLAKAVWGMHRPDNWRGEEGGREEEMGWGRGGMGRKGGRVGERGGKEGGRDEVG